MLQENVEWDVISPNKLGLREEPDGSVIESLEFDTTITNGLLKHPGKGACGLDRPPEY